MVAARGVQGTYDYLNELIVKHGQLINTAVPSHNLPAAGEAALAGRDTH